jgi:small subunit ribosomal protein S20
VIKKFEIQVIMANHKSAQKRIRSNNAKRLRNRYYAKTTRNAVKRLRNTTEKQDALEKLPRVISLVDKLAKRNVIHKNKASNLKSSLMRHVNKMQ